MIDEIGAAYRYSFEGKDGETYRVTLVCLKEKEWAVVLCEALSPTAVYRGSLFSALNYAICEVARHNGVHRQGEIKGLDEISRRRLPLKYDKDDYYFRKNLKTGNGLTFQIVVYEEAKNFSYELYSVGDNSSLMFLAFSEKLSSSQKAVKHAQQCILEQYTESYVLSCEE